MFQSLNKMLDFFNQNLHCFTLYILKPYLLIYVAQSAVCK